MTKPQVERPVSGAELELAQLAQTVIATAAACAAMAEQCEAALISIRTMQLRERQRSESVLAQREAREDANTSTKQPPMFGAFAVTKRKVQ
jgi:hypothetical protein